MTSFPWLTVVGAIPLVGAVVVWLLPSGVAARAKQVALGFSLLTLVAGILAVTQIGHNSVALYALHDGAEDQQESNNPCNRGRHGHDSTGA